MTACGFAVATEAAMSASEDPICSPTCGLANGSLDILDHNTSSKSVARLDDERRVKFQLTTTRRQALQADPPTPWHPAQMFWIELLIFTAAFDVRVAVIYDRPVILRLGVMV